MASIYIIVYVGLYVSVCVCVWVCVLLTIMDLKKLTATKKRHQKR